MWYCLWHLNIIWNLDIDIDDEKVVDSHKKDQLAEGIDESAELECAHTAEHSEKRLGLHDARHRQAHGATLGHGLLPRAPAAAAFPPALLQKEE